MNTGSTSASGWCLAKARVEDGRVGNQAMMDGQMGTFAHLQWCDIAGLQVTAPS